MGKRKPSPVRTDDINLSTFFSDILDKTFYPQETTNFQRINTFTEQIKGVDVIFDIGDKHYICDEKAAVTWRNLNTYSLEISFINSMNKIQDGWLVSDNEINNAYVFIWIDDNDLGSTTRVNYKHIKFDKITVAIIQKQKIIEYLESLGWTTEKLKQKATNIRNNPNKEYMGNIKKDGCKFSFTTKLVEQPINVILPKSVYLQMADKTWEYISDY